VFELDGRARCGHVLNKVVMLHDAVMRMTPIKTSAEKASATTTER